MLTFFRRIRKSLLDSSQAQKYLLYTIGEIALVVIGILIALRINNWNEYRIERQEELKIVNAIYKELQNNLDYLEIVTAYYQTTNEEGGKRLLNYIGTNPAPVPQDTFLHVLRNAFGEPAFAPRISTFSNIITSNEFNLIKYDSLKYLLNEYQFRLKTANYNWDNRQESSGRFHIYLENEIGTSLWSTTTIAQNKKTGFFAENVFTGVKTSDFRIDVQGILSDKRFEALVSRHLINYYYHDKNISLLIDHIRLTIQFIRDHYEI